MKKFIIFIATTVVLLAGCNMSTRNISNSDLIHHRFELVVFNNQDVIPIDAPVAFIEFNEKMFINGKMCNRFSTKATLSNNILITAPIAMTRMACPNEIYNQLDNVISDLLTKGAKVSYKDNYLTLSNNENTLIFKLRDLIN